MNNKHIKASFRGLLFSLACFSTVVNATLITEIEDAGDNLATAQILGQGITEISGLISNDNDVDMFAFDWSGGQLELSAQSQNGDLDTQLSLFDSNGFGLFHNDDIVILSQTNSFLSINVVAGFYYLAISSFSNDPLDIDGNEIFPKTVEGAIPANVGVGALSTWEFDGSSNGTYTITTSPTGTTAVSEPSALALFTFGFLALGYRRFVSESPDAF